MFAHSRGVYKAKFDKEMVAYGSQTLRYICLFPYGKRMLFISKAETPLRRVHAKKYPNFLREQKGYIAMFLYKSRFRKYRVSCFFPSYFVCVNTAL